MSDSKPSADELAAWQAEDADWLASPACDVTAPAPVAEHSDGFCMVCPPSGEARCECSRSSGLGSLGDAVGAPTPGVPIASTAAARAPLHIVIDKDSYKSKKKSPNAPSKRRTCSTPKCTTTATAPIAFKGKGAESSVVSATKRNMGKRTFLTRARTTQTERAGARVCARNAMIKNTRSHCPSALLASSHVHCVPSYSSFLRHGWNSRSRTQKTGVSGATHCARCAENLGFKAQPRSGASVACCRAIHELDREGSAKPGWLTTHGHYARVLAPGGPDTFDNNEVKHTVPFRDLMPDAVDFKSRTVFLYHGNEFHGVPPDHKDFEEGKSIKHGELLKDLYRRTMADHEAYVDANWTVQYMWEHEHHRASRSGLMSISSCLRTHVSANASASSASSA